MTETDSESRSEDDAGAAAASELEMAAQSIAEKLAGRAISEALDAFTCAMPSAHQSSRPAPTPGAKSLLAASLPASGTPSAPTINQGLAAAQALHKFIVEKRGGQLSFSAIDYFYRAHPGHAELLKHKTPSAFVAQHHQLFCREKNDI